MIGPVDDRNIIINQIFSDNNRASVKDIKPFYYDRTRNVKALCLSKTRQLCWYPIIDGASNIDDKNFNIFKNVSENKLNLRTLIAGNNIKLSYTKNGSLRIDSENTATQSLENDLIQYFDSGENVALEKLDNGKIRINVQHDFDLFDNHGKLEGTEIYIQKDRIGFGRKPSYDYKLDIPLNKNKSQNAIHLGDGTYGFSLGNGTSEGFLPQITGVGSNSDDAGLYIIGKTSRSESSDVPLILFDGRNRFNGKVDHRPLLGVTNSNYEDYHFLINHDGNIGIDKKPGRQKVEANGNMKANDFILPNNLSVEDLYQIVRDQQNKIEKLTNLVETLIERI